MGTLIYGTRLLSIDIDDRTLAHLRVVTIAKLRRAEPFMLELEPDGVRRVLWIHPGIALQFRFDGPTGPLNRAWLDLMERLAASTRGLVMPPEPTED